MPEYLAKRNQDESFSISIPAADLEKYAFVDYYDEKSGDGFQRLETLTPRRAREIAEYIKTCAQQKIPWRLFEMTGNVRGPKTKFRPFKEDERLGFLEVAAKKDEAWLSMIDGGTRLRGIKNALAEGTINGEDRFDLRIFTELSKPEEIALFLLVNEKQKRVRTDLALRVVQRLLDEGHLSEDETATIGSVVPDTDAWRYQATRYSAKLNTDPASPWRGMIQMPGDDVVKTIKLQAMLTSLKPILTDPEIKSSLEAREKKGELRIGKDRVNGPAFLFQILINFWTAVREVSPKAYAEPATTVLWGSIGANACHIALARMLATILANEDQTDLGKERFLSMIGESDIAEYHFWFTKPGKEEDYPPEKGDAPKMTGAANYARVGKTLEQQWRAALQSVRKTATAIA
jgi:DGQHR domain-containing protein